jgi:hypothetical protein
MPLNSLREMNIQSHSFRPPALQVSRNRDCGFSRILRPFINPNTFPSVLVHYDIFVVSLCCKVAIHLR